MVACLLHEQKISGAVLVFWNTVRGPVSVFCFKHGEHVPLLPHMPFALLPIEAVIPWSSELHHCLIVINEIVGWYLFG